MSVPAGDMVGYGLERAREHLQEEGIHIAAILRIEAAAGSRVDAEEFVVRQRTLSDQTVELTVCRRWAEVGQGDAR